MGSYLSTDTEDDEVKSGGSKCQTKTEKCPSCSGTLKPCLDRVGQPLLYTQCSLMPESHRFCRSCLAPWKPIHEDGMERCNNWSCEVVSVLLTCDKVTDPMSNVLGCPVFRACPKCYSLIMHESRCKYVTCKKCKHKFCFICLEPSKTCRQDRELYWSLTCKKPQAQRQRFVTGKPVPHTPGEGGMKPSDQQTDTDKCPSCSGILKPCLDRVGQPLLYTQCSLMPESHRFCRSCLAPCKPIHEHVMERCSNRSCEVVSVLLTCDKVTDPKSNVLGCPVFRACPKYYSLIMHEAGCKYVFCKKCGHYFCFICLRSGHSCGKVVELYSSLTCRKPQAGRQMFIT